MSASGMPARGEGQPETHAARGPVASRVDLFCLTLVVGYGLYRALMDLTHSTGLSTVADLYPMGTGNLVFALESSVWIILSAAAMLFIGCRFPRFRFRVPGVVCIVLVAGDQPALGYRCL